MITETGKNLNVLIITEMGQDWQTFTTWYSLYKNLPDAHVVIACLRNKETPFQHLQWTKRLQIRTFYQKQFSEDKQQSQFSVILEAVSHGFIKDTVLVIPHLTMAIDTLDPLLVNLINAKESLFWSDGDVWFMKGVTQPVIEDMLNHCILDGVRTGDTDCPGPLIKEAKETHILAPLVSYRKGVGKWIDSLKGCPLSNASGLISEEMTVNENRIIELWRKMVALYSAVAY